MQKLNLALNLMKIHKIRKILNSSILLNFRKCGEVSAVTPELMARYRQGDIDAANIIAREILKNIHGAMKHFGITEMVPYQEWTDFRDKTAERVWSYTVPRYDPEKGKFSTLVFSMVDNMWKNWLKNKAVKPLDVGHSLDEPIGEEGATTGEELLQDPLAMEFKSEIESQLIESALLENIENPRHKEILNLWISEDPRMGPKEKAATVAKKYNAAHPENPPLKGYRVYRIMIDEIYPIVLDKFPEFAGGHGFMANPVQDDKSSKWVRKPKPEDLPSSLEIGEEEEEEVYTPIEERIAPVYRIDPQTGERILISLNMKRRITAMQEAGCHNLLTFLSIERYGKFKRIVESNEKR